MLIWKYKNDKKNDDSRKENMNIRLRDSEI